MRRAALLLLALAAPARAQDLPDEPNLPGPETIDGLLHLPRPFEHGGIHPIRPLPYSPGAIPGISAEQDLIHHGRRQIGFVGRWNFAEVQMRTASDASAWAEAQRGLAAAASQVQLHEIYWWQMAPVPTPARSISPEVTALLASPSPAVLDTLPESDGWLLTVLDLERGTVRRCAATPDFPPVWGLVPLTAVDLYAHAYVIDRGANRPHYLRAAWRALRPERAAARLRWARDLRACVGADRAAPLELSPTLLASEEAALRAEEWLARAEVTLGALSPEVTEEELAGMWPDLFGVYQTQEGVAQWLAWAPGWAVLAWDPQSGTPMLLSVERRGEGRVWGAIPLLALARRARPVELGEARQTLLRLPWRSLYDRIAALRAVGPGAELP